jgi:hypothetical protein
MISSINLDKLKNDIETPSITKEAIKIVQEKGFLSSGQFLRQMSTIDILGMISSSHVLLQDIETACKTGVLVLGSIPEAFVDMVEVLSIGEGLDGTNNLKVLYPRIKIFMLFLTIEQLVRLGMPVKVNYDQMRLDEIPSGTPILEISPACSKEDKLKYKSRIDKINKDLEEITSSKSNSPFSGVMSEKLSEEKLEFAGSVGVTEDMTEEEIRHKILGALKKLRVAETEQKEEEVEIKKLGFFDKISKFFTRQAKSKPDIRRKK